MARYIDLDAVEFLKVDGNEEFNHGVDCCINKLLEIEPADVVERDEYKKLKKENVELKIKYDDAEKRCCHAMDRNAKLRSKIDNAIEEIDELDGEFLTIYDGTNKLGSGKYVYIEEVLEILKRNIGE